MVREIVHLQVGQCGNQLGLAFWNEVCNEHCLSKDGSFIKEQGHKGDSDDTKDYDELTNIGVYFEDRHSAGDSDKYVPRAIIVDLEPGTVDVIKATERGGMFKPDFMVFGNNGAGNNWAKGHYTEGAELVDNVMDATRKATEDCDAPQGFQIFHSLGGGTGSCMGSLVLLKIRDTYPDKITCTYSVYPSPKVSDTVVEPYNAVLSTHQLLENSDETFIIDNEALYNISHNILKNKQPTYSELNRLIAHATCGITASLRFSGKLNGDLRKLGVNLVPFPRLHFFLVSYAPIIAAKESAMVKLTVKELTKQAYSARNFFSNVKPDDGKYLATSFVFRGSKLKKDGSNSKDVITTEEVDAEMEKLQNKQADDFVDWIPNNIKSSIVDVPPKEHSKCATFVANTTALKGIFQRLATQFGAMYRRKAFLHWYKGEGMDEMEFQEADKNVRDLITEYQDKQDAVYEDDDDDEDNL